MADREPLSNRGGPEVLRANAWGQTDTKATMVGRWLEALDLRRSSQAKNCTWSTSAWSRQRAEYNRLQMNDNIQVYHIVIMWLGWP